MDAKRIEKGEDEMSGVARQPRNGGNGKKICGSLFVDTDDFDRGVSTSTTHHYDE